MSTFQTREEIEAAGFERYTDQPVAVGDTVVIHARGYWRSAPVTKVTPKYVFADVTTPTSPDLHTVGRGDRTGRLADLYVARSREVPGFFVRPRSSDPAPGEPIFTVGFSDETLAQMRADGVIPPVPQPDPQMPAWEQLPDRGLMSRDYIVRLPFVIETGKWGERADCIHRWYNHYEHSWVVSFALMTDFNDGRGETPAQVGPSQYVHSKDDSQREAEHLWKQALVSPRLSDPAQETAEAEAIDALADSTHAGQHGGWEPDVARSGESFKAVDDGEAVIFAIVGPVVMGDLDTPEFQGPAFTVYLSGWVREGEWRHEVASVTFVVRPMGDEWLWSGETLPGVPDLDLVVSGPTPHAVAERIAVAWRQAVSK